MEMKWARAGRAMVIGDTVDERMFGFLSANAARQSLPIAGQTAFVGTMLTPTPENAASREGPP
jgi:hypothetical protein